MARTSRVAARARGRLNIRAGRGWATTAAAASVAGLALVMASLTSLDIDDQQIRVISPAVSDAMHAVALTPETLAAAGVSPARLDGVVANVREHLAEEGFALQAAREEAAAAKTRFELLLRRVRGASGTPADVAALSAARAELRAADARLRAALDACFAAGTAGLEPSQVLTLRRIRANQGWEIPVQHLVVDRTEAEWVALREALANERISQAFGEAADEESHRRVLQSSGSPAVAAASVGLSSNLTAMQEAWREAFGGL